MDYESIPWEESFVDRCRIKANYNAGLVVVRTHLGILCRWGEFFRSSLRQGLRPHSVARSFRAGAGWVGPAASKLWGSNQAALALALWSTSRRVCRLPATYNYPLHLHNDINPELACTLFPELVHVHYHWLLAKDALPTNPLFQAFGPLSRSQHDWLRAATPIG